MVRLNWRGLDCGNYTILREKLASETNGRVGIIMQGLFPLIYIFFEVNADNRWNKKLLGRLYFISF